jgi:predicted regulator of Ras-like GTPase activity (Roadblock/LC7/MglB family)
MSPVEEHNIDLLRNRISVSAAQQDGIQNMVKQLKKQIPATLVLVADRNGQIIFMNGDMAQTTIPELAALLAADLAASEEIARLTDTYQEHHLILREGEKQHTFISEAGPNLALFVQTGSDVPLGWSRMLIQEASSKFAELVADQSNKEIAEGFTFNVDEFNSTVDGAIDDLWN